MEPLLATAGPGTPEPTRTPGPAGAAPGAEAKSPTAENT